MIIESLLDTDFYKFTMMQVVLHQFSQTTVEYRFKARNSQIDLVPFVNEINAALDELCQLRIAPDELLFLKQFRFLKPDFLEFLRLYSFNRDYITVVSKPEFNIIIKGPWLYTILFEVPVLAIINEIYYRHHYNEPDFITGTKRLLHKIERILTSTPSGEFKLTEFGTRRRFSRIWQEQVLATLKKELPQNIVGTSNVFFAKKIGLKPEGTMAHEYIQACQASKTRLIDSQKYAFMKWTDEYRSDLGIALSDTYGLNVFLRDFDAYFSKLFSGVRHDSGDPFDFGERMIEHYESLHIDTQTKTLVFSDALNIGLALELFWRFKDRIKVLFGIGSNLTNDLGYDSLHSVIKLTECDGQAVAKISDSPEKTFCKDPLYLEYLKSVFKI